MNKRHFSILWELRARSPQYPDAISNSMDRYLSSIVIDLQVMLEKKWVVAIPDPATGVTKYINGKPVVRKQYAITEAGLKELRISAGKPSAKERLFGTRGKPQPS